MKRTQHCIFKPEKFAPGIVQKMEAKRIRRTRITWSFLKKENTPIVIKPIPKIIEDKEIEVPEQRAARIFRQKIITDRLEECLNLVAEANCISPALTILGTSVFLNSKGDTQVIGVISVAVAVLFSIGDAVVRWENKKDNEPSENILHAGIRLGALGLRSAIPMLSCMIAIYPVLPHNKRVLPFSYSTITGFIVSTTLSLGIMTIDLLRTEQFRKWKEETKTQIPKETTKKVPSIGKLTAVGVIAGIGAVTTILLEQKLSLLSLSLGAIEVLAVAGMTLKLLSITTFDKNMHQGLQTEHGKFYERFTLLPITMGAIITGSILLGILPLEVMSIAALTLTFAATFVGVREVYKIGKEISKN